MGEPLKCKKCGWLIGSSGICRNCKPSMSKRASKVWVLVSLVALFLVIKSCYSPPMPTTEPTPSSIVQPSQKQTPTRQSVQKIAPTGQHVITSANKWGCTDREYVGKLFGFVADQDKEAFMRGIAEGLATGRCTTFEVGEPVFLADTAIMSGLVKVRRKGETSEYWTAMEAIN